MANANLTASRARELFKIYDGVLIRLKNIKGGAKVGDRVSALDGHGYIHVGIDGRRYRAHRVVWLIINGEWPVHDLDHKNGIKTDNRIENLRECTCGENQQNMGIRINNKTGFVGVSKSRNGKWQASIRVNSKSYGLGYSFSTPEAAHQAYMEAKKVMHKFQPTPRLSCLAF